MLKEKTTLRSYQLLLLDNHDLVEKTIDVYTKGASAWLDFWLTVLGGIEFEMIPLSPLSSYCITKKLKRKSQEDKEIFIPISEEALLFGCWFSLETNSNSPFIISVQDVWNKFKSYLPNNVKISYNWERTIKAQINSFVSENTCWVDRRKAFQDLSFKINVADLVCKKDFWLNKDVDSKLYMRSALGQWWNDGTKSDWVNLKIKCEQSIKFIEQESDIRNAKTKILQSLGLPDIAEAKEIGKAYGKKGKPSRVFIKLEKLTEDTTKDQLVKEFQEEIVNAEEHVAFKRCPWHAKIRENIEKAIGVSYFNEKGNSSQNNFGEMGNLALEKIKSWKSNFFNVLGERYHNCKSDFHDSEVKEWFEEYKKTNKQLRNSSLSGLEKVFDLLDNKSFEDAIKEAQKSYNILGRRFGDANFFNFLGNKIQSRKDKDWLKLIREYDNWDNVNYKFINHKSPRLKHFGDDHLATPRFGESRPTGNIKSTTGNSHSITLNVFDGKSFKLTKINSACKRLSNEIKDNQSIRQTKLSGKIFENYRILPKSLVKKGGLKLCKQNDKWYAHLTVNLPVFEKASWQKLMKTGTIIMSIDPGIRSSISYTIFEIFECDRDTDYFIENGITHVKIHSWEDHSGTKFKVPHNNLWVKLLEWGHIRDLQPIGENGYRQCRLDGGTNTNLDSEEIEFWKYLLITGVEQKDMPDPLPKRSEYSRIIANLINKWYTNKSKEITDKVKQLNINDPVEFSKTLQHVRKESDLSSELLIKASQILFVNNSDKIGRGGLSYARIKMLQTLSSACNKFLKVKENNAEIIEFQNFLRKKINAIRTERVRITVNKVLHEAVNNKVNLILYENTQLKSSSSSPRGLNRSITSWCPSKVIEELKKQIDLLPISIMGVNSAYTSHNCFVTCKKKCRYDKVHLDDLNIEPWKERITDIFTKKQLSLTDCLLKKGWENFLKENDLMSYKQIPEFVKNKKAFCLVPSRTGKLFVTEIGELNADIAAAATIGMKGLAIILSKA